MEVNGQRNCLGTNIDQNKLFLHSIEEIKVWKDTRRTEFSFLGELSLSVMNFNYILEH